MPWKETCVAEQRKEFIEDVMRGDTFYEKHRTPNFGIEIGGARPLDEQIEAACAWLHALEDDAIILGFGGPRASEFPGVYDIAYQVATRLFRELA